MKLKSRAVRDGVALAILCATIMATGGVERASAQGDSRQSAEYLFTEQRPAVPAGVTLRIDYVDPDDPDGKPPAVRDVVETLAPGARIDTAVPEQCGASDPELMLEGASACPAASRVGTGTLTIDTGIPGPARFVVADVIFINNENELIFLSTVRGSDARVVSRSAIEGRSIVSEAPTLPGTPPDGGSLDYVEARLDRISREVDGVRRGYLTTPEECPASGAWTNTIHFTYDDGVSQMTSTPSACSQDNPSGGPCARTWSGSDQSDRHAGMPGGDRLRGRGGDDRLRGRGGHDCIDGQRGDDELRGGLGADRVRGGTGADHLRGGAGADRLSGGRGSDLLRGSRGNDVIDARDGDRDRVRCGRGRDVVEADARDRLSGGCERVH